MAAVDEAYGEVDEAAFDRATKSLTYSVACLDTNVPPGSLARLHRSMALASFVNGQVKAARLSLAAARLADPAWTLDEAMFPNGHPYPGADPDHPEPIPMTEHENVDFLINKTQWRETRFGERAISGDLAPGEVLFRVDRFAFTANNITYAAAGDMLGYWRFFPADEGWGRLPTMGYGDVVASTHPDVAVGTRCFGFYPMSNYLCIQPASASATSIVDGVAHRADLSPFYNQYSPVDTDPLYSAEHEDETILMRGLYMTSFLSEDSLADNGLYGAKAVLISSASSKTSIALAFRLKQTGSAQPIGLTSPGNLDFVKSLGCYDQVVEYGAIESLPATLPVVFVDMAGSDSITRDSHPLRQPTAP